MIPMAMKPYSAYGLHCETLEFSLTAVGWSSICAKKHAS